MTDYGFKVSKPGYSVLTATPQQLIFSSKYTTLRVQSRGSGTVTDSGSRLATIAHGLGYVPMFVVHGTIFGGSTNYYPLPYVNDANSPQAWCWADSTNIYIKVSSTFGYQYFYTGGEAYNYCEEDSGGFSSGWCEVGQDDGSEKGALRFNSVALTSNPYLVKLHFNIQARQGTGDILWKFYGIEEADTANFSSSPFSRKHTDTVIDKQTGSGATAGTYEIWDATTLATEIIGTGGWASGNHMGFFMENNSTSGTNSIYDEYINTENGLSKTYLSALQSNTLLNYKYTIFKDKIE